MVLTTKQLQDLFNDMDLNKDGSIDAHELQLALKKVGRDVSIVTVQSMIDYYDEDKNKTLEFPEFIKFMHRADSLLQVEVPGRTRFLALNSNAEMALKTLVAGGTAGALSRTIVSPFERLKILFQTQVKVPGEVPKYNTVTQSLKLIWKEEGIAGFMRGNGVNVLRIAPTSAIQFYAFEKYKRYIADMMGKDELTTATERLIAGGLTGITALVICYPLDFLRARITIQNTNAGIWNVLKTVIRTEGIHGLYRGLWPSILGVVPYVGVDFAVFDTLKKYMPRNPDETIPARYTLGAGAIAGTIGQTIAYPLDLVRRRLQVQTLSVSQHIERYDSTWDAFRKIYRQEGLPGFYRGLVPNYIKVVPSLAVAFATYEKIKEKWNIPHQKKIST